MRQVVVNLLCDPHHDREEGVEEPAKAVLISLDGEEGRLVDMCDVDEKQYIEPLRRFVKKYGYLPNDKGEPTPSEAPTSAGNLRFAEPTEPAPPRPTPVEKEKPAAPVTPISTRRKTGRAPRLRGVDTTNPGVYLCPPQLECKHTDPLYSRQAFQRHLDGVHGGVSIRALEGQYGNLNHVNDPKYKGALTRYKCKAPRCTRAYPTRKAQRKHHSTDHPELELNQ